MSAVRVTPQCTDPAASQMAIACDGVSTDGLKSVTGTAHGLCVLTRVLLGIVETAVADVPSRSLGAKVSSSLPLTAGRCEGIFDRSTACVLLLVLVRKADQTTSSGHLNGSSPSLQLLPRNEIIRATELFLQLLRDKDAFVQDMSCAGLCVLFNSACHLDQTNGTSSSSSSSSSSVSKKSDANATDQIGLSLSDIVGREVIATLTREKRAPQAAGV